MIVSSQAVTSQPYFFGVHDHTQNNLCTESHFPSSLGIHQGSRRWIKFRLSLAPRYQKIRFLVLTSKFQSLQCGNVIATAALFKERRPVTLLIFIAWVAVKKVSFYWPRWTHQIILGKHSSFFDNVEYQQQRHFFARIYNDAHVETGSGSTQSFNIHLDTAETHHVYVSVFFLLKSAF